ncbi:MAG: FluC/FEX family fluoride channel [Cyanobium sp.]
MAAPSPPRSRRREALDLTLVAAGAIPGALLRWQLPDLLLANLLGCLLLGALLALPSPRPRLMLWGGIGFCGSLTSFSSWMPQLAGLSPLSGDGLRTLLLPLAGGVLALLAGRALGKSLVRLLVPPRRPFRR